MGCTDSTPESAIAVTESDEVTAFVNVHVVPMHSEMVMADQTVVVVNDRIAAIGTDVGIPDGATVVDGSGKYLMPGIAEMHGHIPPPTDPVAFTESVLFLYLAAGVTTVRGMLGHEGQLDIRDRINAGELEGPTLYLAGPSFSGGSISSPEEAAARVRQQKEEGWDLLKVHPGLSKEEFDAMATTANEVGIRFGGHVPNDVGLAHAIEMGQETMDHIDGYTIFMDGTSELVSDEKIAEAVQLTVENGVWIVPTMVLWETLGGLLETDYLRDSPGLQYMPPPMVEGWTGANIQRLANPNLDKEAAANRIENRMRLLKALSDADARILMGTDAPQQFSVPGFAMYRELERMAEAGMTPYEIFHSGTVRVGEYFAEQDDFGTIEVGKRADMILLNANPLEDVAHLQDPAGVMVRGEWMPEADIQSRLAEISGMYMEASN